MNRLSRTHRSTKIPNVKLRPAAATTSSSSSGPSTKRTRAQNDAHNEREDDEHFRRMRDDGVDRGAHADADFIGTSAKPLTGAIISMTGLGEAKLALTNYAREMGAQVEGNLTEDVTHLVAERPGSEKYRCALELGMHIVHPDWITEMREKWLDGQDVDPEGLQESYRLKPLEGVTVAFAGCSDVERRTLRSLATALGARVSNELRFDGSVNYLVSTTADPAVSSSVDYILHFQRRARSGIEGPKEQAAASMNVVRPEWLNDCQDADGCLDELHYTVFSPAPDASLRKKLIAKANHKIASPFVQRRQAAAPFNTSSRAGSSQPHANKRPRLSLNGGGHGDNDNAVEEEEAVIRLGNRANQDGGARGEGGLGSRGSFARVMSQIVSTRPGEGSGSGDANAATTTTSTADALQQQRKRFPGGAGSTGNGAGGLLSLSRASSFSQAHRAPIKRSLPKTRRRSDEWVHGSAGVEAGCDDGDHKNDVDDALDAEMRATSAARRAEIAAAARLGTGCFEGYLFHIDLPEPDKIAVLEKALTKAGAIVLTGGNDDMPDRADFCIVSSSSSRNGGGDGGSYGKGKAKGSLLLRQGSDADDRGRPVTHYWVEFCLHGETFVEPDLYFAADPATTPLPLAEAAGLRVMIVGFGESSPELYHARKLVEELGGSVVERLRRGTALTHVLCGTDESWSGSKAASKAAAHGVPLVGLDWLRKARMEGRLDPPPGEPIAIQQQERSVSRSASESLSKSGNGSSSSLAVAKEGSGRTPFWSTSGGAPAAGVGRTPLGSIGDDDSSRDPQAVTSAASALPLAGCFIACSRSIVVGAIAIERKVFALGATYQQTADVATTHLLHRGPQQQPRELKWLSASAVAVHPSWLDRCYDEGVRFDERLFPPSLNPGKSLATIVSAPEVEESLGRQLGSSQAGTSQQQSAVAVAAARPWHRSLSAGTSDVAAKAAADAGAGSAHSAPSLLRGEATAGGRGARSKGEGLATLSEVEVEQQQLLLLPKRGQSASPPAIEALDDGNDVLMADTSSADGHAEGTAESLSRPTMPHHEQLKESLGRTATADQVMALLRSRAVEQSAKRRTRQPPRSRKRRSDEAELLAQATGRSSLVNASSATALSGPGSTSSTSGQTAMSTAERVVAFQAEDEARRAAEAAAHGFSLGLDRGTMATGGGGGKGGSGTQSLYDASLRVVYDDPAARRERQKLLDLVGRGDSNVAAAAAAAAAAATMAGESDTFTEGIDGGHRSSPRPPPAGEEEQASDARGFGTGSRRSPRKSESPTKRPVVRRQPLAR